MPKKRSKETIVVMSAHTDDFVIGAGGTILNYLKEGKEVIAVVFSLGEKSHPWLKDGVIKDIRKKETFDALNIMPCKIRFLDLGDQAIYKDFTKQKKVREKLQKVFDKKPTKIFTHSSEDPHPDHRAVHKITLEMYEKLNGKKKPEVYIYSVWNPVSFKTQFPSLYVNVTKTFFKKLKALKTFESQKFAVVYPTFLLMWRAFKDGFKIRTWFGEHFFRIK